MELPDLPRIPEFYKDEQILVTGASGFMGKVLVEKLLRSCPDLGKIFVIVRAKRDKKPKERWQEVTKNPLFYRLKRERPGILENNVEVFDGEIFDRLKTERPGILENKVEVLDGDMSKLRLGLNDKDFSMLQICVTQIFHAAASVRFDDSLPDAVLLNTRGTLETVKLALGAKKFKVFVHISTAYAITTERRIEERFYLPPEDWRKVIDLSEKLDKVQMTILQQKYIGKYPNTYTFTKHLAESIVWDYRDRIPSIILRPSIVLPTQHEPLEGWTDNFNGPIGMSIGIGKGLLRKIFVKGDVGMDYISVDVATQAVIISAWLKAHSPMKKEVNIYNLAFPQKHVTNEDICSMGEKLLLDCFFSRCLWYPSINAISDSLFWFRINSIFKHLIPSIIIDKLINIYKQKPINLAKIQRRINYTMVTISYFLLADWDFPNDNLRILQKSVLPEDKDDFGLSFLKMDVLRYFVVTGKNSKKYLLNEDDDTFEKKKKDHRRYIYK